MRRSLLILIILVFLVNAVGLPPLAQAQDYRLPPPGVMVHLSPPLDPPILKGIKVHPDDPFQFEFILDKGDRELSNEELKDESSKLIKYFLASLTIPEKDLWVNLSPYEKDRIIPQSFGLTEMGRDLLAEDYMLKQITASLIYPEGEIGKKFWKRIYEESVRKYGTTNIPVNTFNKVWIVPAKAVVYENAKAGTAYVVQSTLKVMLEQDYLSLEKHEGVLPDPTKVKDTNQLASQVVREIVIPELIKEVNKDSNFARLRQVYNSLILATWYKMKIKDSILDQVYSDKNKVDGVNIDDPKEKQRIYERYLRAFKKGVFNYIKEDADTLSQEIIPRKYFSGGVLFELGLGTANTHPSKTAVEVITNPGTISAAMVSSKEVIVGTRMQASSGKRSNTLRNVKTPEGDRWIQRINKRLDQGAANILGRIMSTAPQKVFSLRQSFLWGGRQQDLATGRYISDPLPDKPDHRKFDLNIDEGSIHAFRKVFGEIQSSTAPAQTKLEWLRPLVIYLVSGSYYDKYGKRMVNRPEIGPDGEYFTKSLLTKVMNIPHNGRARANLANSIIRKIQGFQDETIKNILTRTASQLETYYLGIYARAKIKDWENVEITLTLNAPEAVQLTRTGERSAELRLDLMEFLPNLRFLENDFYIESLMLDWYWNGIYSQIKHPTQFVDQHSEIVKEIVRVLSYMHRHMDSQYYGYEREERPRPSSYLSNFQRRFESQGKNERYLRLFEELAPIYTTQVKWGTTYFVADIARRIEAIRTFIASDRQLNQGVGISEAFDEDTIKQIEQLYEAFEKTRNDKIAVYEEPKTETPQHEVKNEVNVVTNPEAVLGKWWDSSGQKKQNNLVTTIYSENPWWQGGTGLGRELQNWMGKVQQKRKRQEETIWQHVGLSWIAATAAVAAVFWAISAGVFNKAEESKLPTPVEVYKPVTKHRQRLRIPQPAWKPALDIDGGPSIIQVFADGEQAVEDASYDELSKRLEVISGKEFFPEGTMFSTRYLTVLQAGGFFTGKIARTDTIVPNENKRAVLRMEFPDLKAHTRIGLLLPLDWGVVEIRGPDNKIVKIDTQSRLQRPINAGLYTYTIAPTKTEFDTQGIKKGNLDAEFKIIDNDPLFKEFRDAVKKADGRFYDVQNAVDDIVEKYMSYNPDYNTQIGPVFTDMFVRMIRKDGYMNSQCNIGSYLSFILFKYAGFDVIYEEGWMMGYKGLVKGDIRHATVSVKAYGSWTEYDSTVSMGLFLENPRAYEERRKGKEVEEAAKKEIEKSTSEKSSNTSPGKKSDKEIRKGRQTLNLDELLKNGKIITLDRDILKLFESMEPAVYVKEIRRVITLSSGVHLFLFNGETTPIVINENVPKGTTPEAWEKRAHVATKKELDQADQAMKTRGGINFNSDKLNLQIQNAGEGIKFRINPAMLAQLQNAPGFVPVIISIEPMVNLRQFLGVA